MNFYGRFATLTMAAALGLAVSVPPVLAADAFSDLPIVKDLYAKAKTEGEIDLWGPAVVELEWIPAAFSKRFPGIEVQVTSDVQAGTKIIAEARAGKHSVDSWAMSLGGLIETQKRGLLEKIDWPAFGVDKNDIFFEGNASAIHNFVYSFVYAKDKLAAADLPKKWEDLTAPQWQGKLMATDFLLPRMMGFLALEWGPERTEKWARTLIDDGKLLITNAPAQNFLKSGERLAVVGDAVADSYFYTREGVPSAYAVMDIVPATQFAVAVIKDAPHPNAARLMAAWLTSREGRDLFDKLVHEPDIRPGSTAPLALEIKAAGSKTIFEDVETMDKRAEYYKKFSALVRAQ